ncbi:MAG: histidine--tRNA ligase [Wolinella sp.]
MERQLIVPRTLSGFRDRLPKEAMAKSRLVRTLSDVFEGFGFVPIETPHLEYADILVKQGSDEIQKELYRFLDHGGRDVALRFDQTVPLARFISQHRGNLTLPFKRYAIGNVFRGERAQRGRYREFTQCDFDFIGSESIGSDAEILQVIYASLKALGIEKFTIFINSRKVLNGICEHFGVAEHTNNVLRIIDKLDKIGTDAVIAELVSDAGLNEDSARGILDFTSLRQESDSSLFFEKVAKYENLNDQLKAGISELRACYAILDSLELERARYRVNFSIARGLGYYTGLVYETILDELPSIGSVCSGGRYDDLTQSFSKEHMSGVGASIGLDRLLAALDELGLLSGSETSAKILIACMEESYISYGYKVAQKLRESGIKCEVYPEAVKLKKSLTYANNKGHKYVALIGESEIAAGKLALKNMKSGAQELLEVREVATKILGDLEQ